MQMHCLKKGQVLFCSTKNKAKKHCDSTKKFSESDITQMLEFLIDNIFAIFSVGIFQQSRHSYGYYLSSPSRRFVSLFVRGIPQIGASEEKWKEANPIL